MKEYPEYRDVLADLISTYDNRTWIRSVELAAMEGCKVSTVEKRYGIPKGCHGIDRAVLARRKCQLAYE